eukprot:gene4907-5151_t
MHSVLHPGRIASFNNGARWQHQRQGQQQLQVTRHQVAHTGKLQTCCLNFKQPASLVEQPSTTNCNSSLPPKSEARITVFSAAQYVEGFLKQPLIDAGFINLKFTEARLQPDTAALAEGSPIVCLFVNDICDAQVVEQLKNCGVQMIAMRCAGYDRVDLEACQAAGIQVVRVPTYSPTSVAEHAVALMFALSRHLHQAYIRVSAGNYSLTPLVGMELRGKRVGVIGTGAIGTEAVRIFKVKEMGVPYMDLDEIIPQVHVLSLHVPLLPSTKHILNKDRVKRLRQGCLVLNVSRGGLVDNSALLHGLEQGNIGGLGMDVYENEGQLFFTDWTDMDLITRMKNWDRCFKTLTSYPQVLITPHSAFLTVEALNNIASTTASNLEEFFQGRPLTNAVQPRRDDAAGKK